LGETNLITVKAILYQLTYFTFDFLRSKRPCSFLKKMDGQKLVRPFKEEKRGYDYDFKIGLYS